MPSRQFSSPAWFWKQLCQNWTLSTKCFDVDESVNSNENLFSQNFSDQLYFPFCQAYLLILRLSVWLQAKVFCHGHPGCRVQAQLNTSSCPPGSSPSMSLWERSSMQQHSSLPPSPSISQLHPDHSSIQIHVDREALLWGLKYHHPHFTPLSPQRK